MVFAALVQFVVCFIVLGWLMKKTGGRFTKKTVVKFILFGAIGVVLWFCLSLVLPLDRDTFFGINPILAGFLTAFISAALVEEIVKYIMFRLAIRKNREVVCWMDAIIAAIAVGVGFTLLEDITYLFDGAGTIVRAFVPGHLLFQGLMGYYYGQARVTRRFKYHVLSLAVPILVHTLFDMFILGMLSILGSSEALIDITEEQLASLPYYDYLIPMLTGAVAVILGVVVALILFFRKIAVWSREGKKQELLNTEA